MGSDVSTVARDKLSDILESLLQEYMIDVDCDLEEAQIGTVWTHDVNSPSNTRCLFLPILSLALSRIDFFSVAEAILMKHGKWNPDDGPPEFH